MTHQDHVPAASELDAFPQIMPGETGSESMGLLRHSTSVVADPTDGQQHAHVPRGTSSIGSVDRIDCDEISGWACDPDHPDQSIDVEILDDDVVVLKVCADQFRPDLVEAGVGNGRHGFFLRGLDGVFPLSRHLVRVRRASDGRDLPRSPAWITRRVLDDRAVDFIQQVVFSAVERAASSDDLANPLSYLLRLLNDVVNAQAGFARAESDKRSLPPIEAAAGLMLTDQMRELVSRLQHAHAPLYFEPRD